jgi:hypothetical protein
MTKEELVYITLKQLGESLKRSPENFRLEDHSVAPASGNFPGPTIVWQFRIQLEEDKFIPDPLNSVKTIIVTYNKIAKQLQCYIYNREVNSMNHAMMADAQVTLTYHEFVPQVFYRTYRQFAGIRRALLKRKHDKEYLDYMKRLNNIFPATHEDDIFK